MDEQSNQKFIMNACREYRGKLKEIEDHCRMLHLDLHDIACGSETSQLPLALTDVMNFREAKAQMKLAYRHMEDARMRLGKVIQYGENEGQSCYDGNEAIQRDMEHKSESDRE